MVFSHCIHLDFKELEKIFREGKISKKKKNS